MGLPIVSLLSRAKYGIVCNIVKEFSFPKKRRKGACFEVKTVKIDMPEAVSEIIGKLTDAGYEAYSVGGCVRDALLGRTASDWDITTVASPDKVKALFKRTVDTGIKHGTVTVLLRGQSFEVTTYRIDGKYTDGRHPESVSFTRSLKEDLLRRDFTINAMAYNDTDGLVDPYGGMEDLKKGIIRCVGNPTERFGEDALRMLRAVRFAGSLSFEIEKETYKAVCELAPSIEKVSPERICAELTKLLVSKDPGRIVLLGQTGLYKYVLKELGAVLAGPQKDRLIKALESSRSDKIIRWAILTSFTGKSVEIMRALRFDNNSINGVRLLNANTDINPDTVTRRELKVIMGNLGETLSRLWFDYLDALFGNGYSAGLRKTASDIIDAKECIYIKDLKISGRDVMSLGCPKGREVGEVLENLLDKVLERPSLNEEETLRRLAAEKISSLGKGSGS